MVLGHVARSGRATALLVLLACSSGLDPNAPAWHRIAATGPGARWGHTAVLDAVRDRMIVFGGQSSEGELADVWALDLGAETWRQLATTNAPSTRVNPAAVVDAVRDRMIVFGGRTGLTTSLDEAWALDLSTLAWSRLPSGPSARQRPHFATDGARAWFYGGESFTSVQGDLWQFDFATNTWSLLPNAGDAPSARTCGAMAFIDGGLVVNGGHDVAFVRDGTWRYDLVAQAWSRVETEGGTAAGAHWAYAVDPKCGKLYLAGGDHFDNYDTALTDVLSLRGPSRFSKVAVSVLPDAHDHASLVLDSARSNLILYGGTLADGQAYLDGTWVLPVELCP